MLFANLLLTVVPTEAGKTTGSASSLLSQAMPFVLLVAVFGFMYFVMIRPQKKRDKELKAQVSKMAVGDTVETIGGLVGTIANIQDDNITLTTSIAHTMVTFKKSAIARIVPRQ